MSFSYSTASPGNRDKVRLLIGDTSSTSYVFEDAELDMLLAMWSNDLHKAAAQAIRTLAINASKRLAWFRINGLTINREQQGRFLIELAENLETQAAAVPWELESIVDSAVLATGEDATLYPDTN